MGTLRIDLQAKLLRAPGARGGAAGGTRTIPLDVRVIAATNVDLRQLVRARAFREDLYYRLNVATLAIPPLRDRKEDIPTLVEHFIRKYAREFKKDVRGISRGALPSLAAYDWPGNVRELENVIERSVALAVRAVIRLDDLPLDLAIHDEPARGPGTGRRCRSRKRATASSRCTSCARWSARTGTRAAPPAALACTATRSWRGWPGGGYGGTTRRAPRAGTPQPCESPAARAGVAGRRTAGGAGAGPPRAESYSRPRGPPTPRSPSR